MIHLKQIIIISLAVITVLSLLLSGCQGVGQAGGLPQIQTPSKPATSCDGDAVCETKNVDVTGDVAVRGNIRTTGLTVRGDLTVGNVTLKEIFSTDPILGALLSAGDPRGGMGGIIHINGVFVPNQGMTNWITARGNLGVVGKINSSYLASWSTPGITGNAYVCADNNGVLFRSGVPCR